MDPIAFRYQPSCSSTGCREAAVFKVAAPWSDGTSRELKNYGLACAAHRDTQLARAQLHRKGLQIAEGETVGPVGIYELITGRRDVDLERLPDHGG